MYSGTANGGKEAKIYARDRGEIYSSPADHVAEKRILRHTEITVQDFHLIPLFPASRGLGVLLQGARKGIEQWVERVE